METSNLDENGKKGPSAGDVCAIIVAAGRGRRMKSDIPKQYLPLAGKPVLAHTIDAFSACRKIDRIVVVAAREDFERFETSVLPAVKTDKPPICVEGGAHRGDSVYRGLAAAGSGTGIAVIHDGVRPLVRSDRIEAVVSEARRAGACILAARAFDTLKQVDDRGIVRATIDRSRIWTAQTPQAFQFQQIWEAHRRAKSAGFSATDDAQLLEWMNLPVHIVQGDAYNLKITTARDLQVAEALLTAPPAIAGKIENRK
jgi:2-C-methyl-D-erythritol 4-phosphate cytidylyltransferase